MVIYMRILKISLLMYAKLNSMHVNDMMHLLSSNSDNSPFMSHKQSREQLGLAYQPTSSEEVVTSHTSTNMQAAIIANTVNHAVITNSSEKQIDDSASRVTVNVNSTTDTSLDLTGMLLLSKLLVENVLMCPFGDGSFYAESLLERTTFNIPHDTLQKLRGMVDKRTLAKGLWQTDFIRGLKESNRSHTLLN